MYKNLEIGRSMIEMLGVLAIIGVLSVGGITGYSKAMERFKINKTIDEISTIIANTQTLYAQQKGYSVTWTSDAISGTNYYGKYDGFNTKIAWDTGIIPEEFKIKNNQNYAQNPFGGLLYIESYSSNGTSFTLASTKMTKEACIALATYDWEHAIDNIKGIAIGGVTGFWPSDGCTEGAPDGRNIYYACPGHLPISAAKAADFCSYPSDYYWGGQGFMINIKE